MSLGTDYPDYQSYANWRGPDLNAAATWPLSNTNPFTAVGYVTNYASLIIYLASAPTDGAEVAVEFWTDETETIQVAAYSWVLAATQKLSVIMPVIANYVSLEMTTPNAASTNVIAAVVPTSTSVAAPAYYADQNYIANLDQSIAASTTVIELLPWVSSGKAHVYCKDIAASGKLTFQVISLTEAGAKSLILQEYDAAVTIAQDDFQVPALPLALLIENTDTAAHTAGYFLSVDGRLG